MSVSGIMNTMMSQDATSTMSADVTSTSMPGGTSNNGKAVVGGIDDIMNLYANGDEDDSPASSNGVKLKEDKSTIPDELNNTVPKEVKKEEEKLEEVKSEVINEPHSSPETFKVKVNGNELDVPLQDLINSYSGNQEIQRRFTDFDKTKKAFESERKELTGMNDYVKQEIGDLKQSFSNIISQYEKNGYIDKDPMESVNQLLDKMGINSNLFQRAVFEHQLHDYAKFFNMNEVERDAHYTKKENEFLRRKEQGFNDRDQQVKLREENQRKDFDLIKNAGLDSVKYDELSNELLEAGHKDLTAQKVVEYAQQKPTLDKVVKVFEAIKVDPTKDERARTVFKILQEYPDTTVEEILDHMEPQRAALKSAQVLASKVPKQTRVPSQRGEDSEFDSMMDYYKN